MKRIRAICRTFLASRSGSINILAAVMAPVVLMMAAFGIDYGNLLLSKRDLQQDADLAAIVGVTDIAHAEEAVLGHFQRNGIPYAVRDGSKMLTADGIIAFNEAMAFDKFGGYAEVVKGRYSANAGIAVDKRFVADTTAPDALKVTIRQSPKLFFPHVLGNAPRLGATGTASVGKLATVAVSSRLVGLDAGLINKILGALTGTTLTLSIMDAQALVDADINLLTVVDQLAMDLNLQVATYDELLATEVTFPQIVAALAKAPDASASTRNALARLAQQASKSKLKLPLRKLLNVGPYARRRVGSIVGLELEARVMEILSAVANLANAGRQVDVDLDGAVPGLASVRLTLLIGEPEVESPMFAIGRPGSMVRTAQTRLRLVTEVNGLSALAGLKLKVPVYLDLAKAEAAITAVNCANALSTDGSADVDAKPSVAEITIGELDDDAFFGLKDTTPGMVNILDSAFLRVRAKARITGANPKPTPLKFSAAEIKAGKVKSAATTSLIAPMTDSLFSDLVLDVQLFNITLGTSQVITKAVGQTLAGLSQPLDQVLFSTLALLGVSVGEANVRVGAASCQRPVVVN